VAFQHKSAGQHMWYEVSGGPAISFVTTENNPFHYGHKIVPHGGVTAFIPFNNRIAFKTGAIYQFKSISSKGIGFYKDSVNLHYALDSKSNYHFINVPLQLAMNIGSNKQGFWRVAAGMSYGFLIAARKHLNMQTYEGNDLLRDNTLAFKPVLGSERSGNYPGLPGQEGTPLHVFTPSVRVDITYQWQERLLLSAFYEYNLQDVRVRTVSNSIERLHYTGISFGVLFW
jgi:hypothetical protein